MLIKPSDDPSQLLEAFIRYLRARGLYLLWVARIRRRYRTSGDLFQSARRTLSVTESRNRDPENLEKVHNIRETGESGG